ncbi:unnamed protein product [Amoebophrya sp. A25]|nr:unnamed protein product [Amoebophrya sp. A25]|eukprot:GSA25T00004411001.1
MGTLLRALIPRGHDRPISRLAHRTGQQNERKKRRRKRVQANLCTHARANQHSFRLPVSKKPHTS